MESPEEGGNTIAVCLLCEWCKDVSVKNPQLF